MKSCSFQIGKQFSKYVPMFTTSYVLHNCDPSFDIGLSQLIIHTMYSNAMVYHRMQDFLQQSHYTVLNYRSLMQVTKKLSILEFTRMIFYVCLVLLVNT